MRFGRRMPGIATVLATDPGASGVRLQECVGERDRRALAIWWRLLREVAAAGDAPEVLSARAAAREEVHAARLSLGLARVFSRFRDLERAWRELRMFFAETEPAASGSPVWIWNGRSENWVAAMRDIAPIFVVIPGRSTAPDLEPWTGPYPEPIVFGDLALDAAEQWPAEETVAEPAGGGRPVSSPSRFAVCVNDIRLRDAHSWETEPLWGRASPAVAGVHALRNQLGEWNSTGAGAGSGWLRSVREVRERLNAPRCEALRDKGFLPVAVAGPNGVAVLGDRTLAAGARPSVGIAILKVEGLAARLVAAQCRRQTVPEGRPHLDVREQAERVMRALLEGKQIRGFRIDPEPGGGVRDGSIELALELDQWAVRTRLRIGGEVKGAAGPEAAEETAAGPRAAQQPKQGGIRGWLRILARWFHGEGELPRNREP